VEAVEKEEEEEEKGEDEQRDEVEEEEEEEMASEDTEMVTGPSGEGTSAGASASAGSKRPKRFEIKKWNAVALWAWGMRLLLVPIVLFLGMQSERRNLLVYEKKIDQRERERERERDFFPTESVLTVKRYQKKGCIACQVLVLGLLVVEFLPLGLLRFLYSIRPV